MAFVEDTYRNEQECYQCEIVLQLEMFPYNSVVCIICKQYNVLRSIANRNKASWNKYGLTFEDVTAILEYQCYKCPICNRILDVNCHVDHEHSSGLVRGILCSKCNLFLVAGYEMIPECERTWEKMNEYLKRSSELQNTVIQPGNGQKMKRYNTVFKLRNSRKVLD